MATGHTSTSRRGRPPLPVDRDCVAYLRSLNFTLLEISSVLGVSSRTLQRKAQEWNISRFTVISDESLDHEIYQIKRDFPNSEEVMIAGHLLSRSIHVQRQKLRDSLARLRGSTLIPQYLEGLTQFRGLTSSGILMVNTNSLSIV